MLKLPQNYNKSLNKRKFHYYNFSSITQFTKKAHVQVRGL